MTEHSGIFPDSKICWCCGNKYDASKKRCVRRTERLGHPCELYSSYNARRCKTRSIQLRKFGHCKGKVKNKSWGLRHLKIKTFKTVEERFKYFDKKLKKLGLRKFARMNEWKDELIQIVISDV